MSMAWVAGQALALHTQLWANVCQVSLPPGLYELQLSAGDIHCSVSTGAGAEEPGLRW